MSNLFGIPILVLSMGDIVPLSFISFLSKSVESGNSIFPVSISCEEWELRRPANVAGQGGDQCTVQVVPSPIQLS